MITGGAGGIGGAMAAELAGRGWDVFLVDIREAALREAQERLTGQFPGVTVYTGACDLTNAESVDGLMERIDGEGLRFDGLISVAGMELEGAFLSREREHIVKIVMLNDVAALRITHAVLERRRENAPFTAVVVASLAAMFPMPLKATYAASKRFLLDFALALRQELKPTGANVLALCPGGIATKASTNKAIAAQGIFGKLSLKPLDEVARKTIDRALAGKAVYIPGAFNRFLALLGKLAPRWLVAKVIYKRWSRAQEQWLAGHDYGP